MTEDRKRRYLDATADHTLTWFESLFTTGGSLGAFFAGFTLSIAVSESTKEPARTYAAISSLLFVFTVLLCAACGLGATLQMVRIKDWIMNRKKRGIIISVVGLVLHMLLLTAIMFFFFVMKASVRVVGWIGLGFTGVAILVALICWIAAFVVDDYHLIEDKPEERRSVCRSVGMC